MLCKSTNDTLTTVSLSLSMLQALSPTPGVNQRPGRLCTHMMVSRHFFCRGDEVKTSKPLYGLRLRSLEVTGS